MIELIYDVRVQFQKKMYIYQSVRSDNGLMGPQLPPAPEIKWDINRKIYFKICEIRFTEVNT